ncbi:hypothetical protein [Aeromonas veronii]|uniref:hypothetical protein n=1 Tax=Aeromonas veronii TaxID=654 RepID=UPI001F2424AC|nr:hypothetical protein [Aeromonas veronii]MCF5912150.1 hypothetical protein [Aeromonas veronii]
MRNTTNPELSQDFNMSDLVKANADRVTITDTTRQEAYRVRVEGENEQSIELTNTGSSTSYMQLLADTLDNAINSEECKLSIGEERWFRFHSEQDVPTPIMIPSLSSRTVNVKMKDPHTNNVMPTKLTIRQGSTIRSKPCEDAIMFSMAIERFDTESDGNITHLTLRQEAESIVEQIDREITTKVATALTTNANKAKYLINKKVDLKAGQKLADRVEAIEDAIDVGLIEGRLMGDSIEDFVIGLNSQTYRDLDRMSRRSGSASVSDYLGTEVYIIPSDPSASDDIQILMAPKKAVAVSFRERHDGTVLDFIVSRQAEKQSTTMEIVGVADLLVAGSVAATGDGGADQEVNIPLIVAFTAETPTAS